MFLSLQKVTNVEASFAWPCGRPWWKKGDETLCPMVGNSPKLPNHQTSCLKPWAPPSPLSGFFSYCPLAACSVASTEFLYTTVGSLFFTTLFLQQYFTTQTVQHCLHYTIVWIRPLLSCTCTTLLLYFSQCPGLAGCLLFTGEDVVTWQHS